jgi:hypothetical protein
MLAVLIEVVGLISEEEEEEELIDGVISSSRLFTPATGRTLAAGVVATEEEH